MRRVLFGLLLAVVVLVPALPQLEAQFKGGAVCPYAMNVSHVHMQNQQNMYYQQMQMRQMQQMQQMQHYQQQMMQQQQRQQQMMMQQQRMQQQQQHVQTHVATQQQHFAKMNVGLNHLTTKQMQMHIPTGVGRVGTHVPWMNTQVHHVNTMVARVNTGVQHVNTAVQTVSTRVNRVDTSVARVNTNVQRVNTSVARVDTSVRKVDTSVAKVDTRVKTVCTSKDMTVVSINFNCMQCHKQMNSVPQNNLPTPVARQNVLTNPVARMPMPQMPVMKQMPLPLPVMKQMPMPNLLTKQMPMPNLVGKTQPLHMPVDRVMHMPTLQMPVVRYLPQMPQPVMVQQPLPMPVYQPLKQPQMVMQLPQVPPLGMPVQQDSYFRPMLSMLVTKTGDKSFMTTSSSSSYKPTQEPIVSLMPVTKQTSEMVKSGDAPRMQIVVTKEMLDQPLDLLMPVTAQTQIATSSGGRLNLGAELVIAESESTPPTKIAFLPDNDDERARPPLPVFPRSVWLPPTPTEEVFEDFDRNPPVFASGPTTAPVENSTTAATTTRSLGVQSLDAPPPLSLPTSVRTPG